MIEPVFVQPWLHMSKKWGCPFYLYICSRISKIEQTSLFSQNAMYYHGRGRVNLLGGDRTKAADVFKKAAELGGEDALNYLEYVGEAKNKISN